MSAQNLVLLMLRKFSMLTVLFTVLFSLPVLNAEVLQFQNGSNGYSGCKDTSLVGAWDANKVYNYGTNGNFPVYGVPFGGGIQDSLIRFQDTFGSGANQVPIGANIISAKLKLKAYDRFDVTGNDTVNVYKMLKDWIPGTANGAAQNGSSCYSYRKYRTDGNYTSNPGDTWGGDGAVHTGPVSGYDYDPTMIASCNIIAGTTPNQTDTTVCWLEFDVTATVKNWTVDQNSNFGLYLYTNGYWPWAYFYSSDNATPANRPILEIEYNVPVLSAEVLRFQNGFNSYSGCKDTSLVGAWDANKVYNYGTNGNFPVYGVPWGGGIQDSLIRFQDTFGSATNQVPTGANIVSAWLRLKAYDRFDLTGNDTVNVYKMLQDWTSGTANGEAQNGSSCYSYRRYRTDGNYAGNPSDTWGGDGAAHTGPVSGYDYDSTMIASCDIIEGTTTNQTDTTDCWRDLDVTAAVKNWLANQNSNFGLYLYTNGYWPWAKFYSSDNVTPVNRPMLEIEYSFSVAKLNFDSIGGDNKTITDISQNNHNLVFNNTVSLSTDIPDSLKPLFAPTTGKSVRLTGNQGILNNPSMVDLSNGAYTLQCWFKPNTVQASTLIELVSSDSNMACALGIRSDGKPEAKLYAAGEWFAATSATNVTAGNWYHFAAVYNYNSDGYLRLYVNAVQVGSYYAGQQSLGSSMSSVFSGGGGIYGYADGWLDELQVENAARSPQELCCPSTVGFDQIVTPAAATGAETFAAEELQSYIYEITGTTLPINQSDAYPINRAIIIGAHPANEFYASKLAKTYPISAGSVTTAMNYEAFGIRYDGKQIHLVGQCEQAVLYAAFDLLETIGVRWVFPTTQGVYVPAQLQLAPFEKYDAPKLWNRGPNYSVSAGDTTFPADLRANEHGVTVCNLFTWRMRNNLYTAYDANKDGVIGLGSGHSYNYYLPASVYGAAHPEWYNLIGGVRQTGPNAQICFTNSAAATQFAANVCSELAASVAGGRPLERTFTYAIPNDYIAWCECSNCQALLSTYEKTNQLAASLVTNFANLVCAKIQETYPGARIVFYAYWNATRPGENVSPASGVYAQVTAYSGSSVNYSRPAMNATYNPNFLNWFGAWAASSDAVEAYTYYGHYYWFTPWPVLTQIANDIPLMYANNKFRGMCSENHMHWGTQLINFWLQSRLMWNPGYDAEKIKDDFYNKGFGPAANDIKNYYNCLQSQMDSDNADYIGGNQEEILTVLTSTVISNCNSYIDAAESKLSQMDANMQWRTNHIIRGWRNSAKMGNAMLLYGAAYISDSTQRAAAKASIISYMNDVKTFANTENGKWAFENITAIPQIDSFLTRLNLPLAAIGSGANQVFDFSSLMFGGAIKFYATQLTGFSSGRWGLCLNNNASGTLQIPITAASGKTITSAKIQVGLSSLSVAKVYVNNVLLASGLPAAAQELTVPSNQLGTTMTFKVEGTNTSGSEQPVISSLKITVSVQ